jgi:hypothetical protein
VPHSAVLSCGPALITLPVNTVCPDTHTHTVSLCQYTQSEAICLSWHAWELLLVPHVVLLSCGCALWYCRGESCVPQHTQPGASCKLWHAWQLLLVPQIAMLSVWPCSFHAGLAQALHSGLEVGSSSSSIAAACLSDGSCWTQPCHWNFCNSALQCKPVCHAVPSSQQLCC